jgi:hypothetical protein
VSDKGVERDVHAATRLLDITAPGRKSTRESARAKTRESASTLIVVGCQVVRPGKVSDTQIRIETKNFIEVSDRPLRRARVSDCKCKCGPSRAAVP